MGGLAYSHGGGLVQCAMRFAWRFSWSDLLARANIVSRLRGAEVMLEPSLSSDTIEFEWIDRRDEKPHSSRGKAKGVRKWADIKGITLHQTAVNFGNDPWRKDLTSIPVHGMTLQSGAIVLLHRPTDLMWHGNGFNGRDIGIEVSCRAAGIEGVPGTLWLPKDKAHLEGAERLAEGCEATDIQIEATKALVRYYVEQVAANGGRIEYIHAHRQATSQRVSDPGSRIWREVGEWARVELGLEVGPPDFAISDGKPLPDAWTGRPNGIKYNWEFDGRLDE